MTLRQIKTGHLVIQWLNSIGTSFYVYYIFFLMQREFGFGDFGNLCVSAAYGFVYTLASFSGGKFGQRFGYFMALAIGFVTMIVALSCAYFSQTAAGQIGWLILWTMGVSLTWPALEALVAEGEGPMGLQRMVGIYNLTWASASALAYFAGGAIVEKLGLRSIFWIPVGIHCLQVALLLWLHAPSKRVADGGSNTATEDSHSSGYGLNPRPIARARMFLRLAWVANPFAYVAINTLAAVIPGLAMHLNLTPTLAGFFCSIWFFVRWLTFLALWLWPGWHYRASWFFGAFVLLIFSFALILLIPSLAIVVVAQIGLGIAVGLIYYSSLFYSMDAGEAKGEQGGVHEAAVGLGIFVGPAVGATTLKLFPGWPNGAAVAVSTLLCLGLGTLLVLWAKGRK